MKPIRTLLLFSAVLLYFTITQAQSGVYLTYDDFKNGNLLHADDGTLDWKPAKHIVTLKTKGDKKEYECNKIFGILLKGELSRFPSGSIASFPVTLMEAGDFCLWNFSETSHDVNQSGMQTGRSHERVVFYMSKGLDGNLYDITANYLLPKITAEHKEFQPLSDCVAKGKKLTLMHPLCTAVGECIYHEPSYKDPKEAIPPLKN